MVVCTHGHLAPFIAAINGGHFKRTIGPQM